MGVNVIEFPLRTTLRVTSYLSFGCLVQVIGYEAVSWQIQGVQKVWGDPVRWWCWSPFEGPGTLGGLPPVEVPVSSDELMAAPVMMAASGSGTLAAQRRAAFWAVAGRLVPIAPGFELSPSVPVLVSHSGEGGLLYSEKRRIWVKGYISNEMGLLKVRNFMLQAGRGEVTCNRNSILYPLSQHWLWV